VIATNDDSGYARRTLRVKRSIHRTGLLAVDRSPGLGSLAVDALFGRYTRRPNQVVCGGPNGAENVDNHAFASENGHFCVARNLASSGAAADNGRTVYAS
jgi:hypothetical protein